MTQKPRAIIVCVDMHDLLDITLPINRPHFSEVVVVTSSKDHRTKIVADKYDALPFVTDSFWDDGAPFRKWKCLEQGLDAMGRHGLLCIQDVDIVWPSVAPVNVEVGQLFSPLRRMCEDIDQFWLPNGRQLTSEQWTRFKTHPNVNEHAGYCQIFHSEDPVLGTPPWHDTSWNHCGGSDSFFQARWTPRNKVRPQWEVLHLGQAGVNWLGRTTPMLDGTVLPGSTERRAQLSTILRERRARQQRGEDMFGHEKIRPSHPHK